ncbi:MAG: class I tRNA ligase family protein, partial [Coriobacteriales bacterium]|nr:class I tRNA ligase family protein [Coriobacteriales bacterium]
MVKDANGDTMSKSKGNVVPPSSVIEPYGADTMRLAILFIAPSEKDFNWDEEVVAGANRFIKRAWRTVWGLVEGTENAGAFDPSKLSGASAELWRRLNEMGIKCTVDFDRYQFNTAISAVMELVNDASKYLVDTPVELRDAALCLRVAHDIVTMLSPICPHWGEELFHEALSFETSVYDESWPVFDAEAAKAKTVQIAVQIKGKVRARIDVAADASKEEAEEAAKAAVANQLEGKTVRKVIYVPGKLVNIVA